MPHEEMTNDELNDISQELFLGMTPKGDTQKLGRGGQSKGSARRPAANSFKILALSQDFVVQKLFAKNEIRSP